MKEAIESEHDYADLTDAERGNLDWSIGLLARVGAETGAKIVTFHRNDLMGLYRGGKIFIARSVLADRNETLGTLIHEYSHGWGPDGSIQHSSKIEQTWVSVSRVICG